MRGLPLSPAAALLCASLLSGCGNKRVTVAVPPPPPASAHSSDAHSAGVEAAREAAEARSTGTEDDTYAAATPIWSETGMASWYGTVYQHRKAANGEVYEQDGMTAAHRTLPLNSIVRVTNLKNGKSAVLRITDRGPFVTDRVIDLSVGAAKALDIWRPGTAPVRIDVLEAPKQITSGGKWCVQIGAFSDVDAATELKQRLMRRYQTARVLQFTGPTGEWLRIRVAADDKQKAFDVARETKSPEGAVFVVRLD